MNTDGFQLGQSHKDFAEKMLHQFSGLKVKRLIIVGSRTQPARLTKPYILENLDVDVYTLSLSALFIFLLISFSPSVEVGKS